MNGGTFLLSLTLLAAPLAFAAPARPEKEIRVRLKRHIDAIEVTGTDMSISPPSAFIETEKHGGFHRAKITRRSSGIWVVKWDHIKKSVKVASERLWVRGDLLRVGLEPAPYDLEILKNPVKAGLDVIARLDLETYLEGVLPGEMPVSWPLEALKAQAVSARSYVLRQAWERRNKDFDVEATVFDQMYKFIDEHKHPEWVEKLRQALSETRGEILLDPNRHVLKAFYSADCGCQTEDPKFVWGKLDAFQSVKDPTCGKHRTQHWSFNLDRAEVRQKLIAALGLPEDANIRALHIAGRTPSGRVANVVAAIDGDGKDARSFTINSQEFRKIFGFEKIQSTDFKLNWLGDQLQVNGTGSGHGVGLCQTGAKSFAESGTGYREILKTYYPKATLTRRI
jgi:stage II sporulation protein D